MDVRRGDRGVSGGDRNLMKVRDDVPCGVQAVHSGALVLVDFETTGRIMMCAKLRPKFGTHGTPERGVYHVEGLAMPAGERHGNPLPFVP